MLALGWVLASHLICERVPHSNSDLADPAIGLVSTDKHFGRNGIRHGTRVTIARLLGASLKAGHVIHSDLGGVFTGQRVKSRPYKDFR
ncbi:hypothetical protein [Mycobacteroides abscessus]|uniref:hypothetical protein n=1 Tax=Mycobacteroides abscessus TaxID=36809 RepID=UPI001055AD57|nr:hypothetical protein [Mycobacteroides abscessus]